MSASPETAAAMTSPAPHHHPAGTASEPPAPGPDTTSPAAGTDMSGAAGGRASQRRELSAGAAFALFGGLMTTMLGVLAGLMMWQFDSLGDRIDTQSDRIDTLETNLRGETATLGTELRSEIATLETNLRGEIATLGTELRSEIATLETNLRGEIATLGTELRSEIGDLRSEMQAGFREVNATLLDHTDRLARLEASVDAGT